jgi:hypothetical protein
MRWMRTAVAAGVLAGLVGCSSKPVASKPDSAPPPSEEKPLGPPKAPGSGGGPGPKQRPFKTNG